MRTLITFVKSMAVIIGCFVMVGCASIEEKVYVATGTIVASVNAAKDYYDDLVSDGKVTLEQQAKVEKLLASYQKALSAEHKAVLLYRKTKDRDLINRTFSELKSTAENLISEIRINQPRKMIGENAL